MSRVTVLQCDRCKQPGKSPLDELPEGWGIVCVTVRYNESLSDLCGKCLSAVQRALTGAVVSTTEWEPK